MAKIKVKSVKEILDPHSRFIFFDDEGINEAFVIAGVEKNLVYLECPEGHHSGQARDGYFVAASGRGIVRFSGFVTLLPAKPGSRLAYYQVVLDLTDLELMNRRSFSRHDCKFPMPMALACDGKKVKARMTNISEGGVRIRTETRLPTQVVFGLQLNLGDLNFSTDGLLVYSEPEQDPTSFVAGIMFVAPAFKNNEEKADYTKAQNLFRNFLARNNDFFV